MSSNLNCVTLAKYWPQYGPMRIASILHWPLDLNGPAVVMLCNIQNIYIPSIIFLFIRQPKNSKWLILFNNVFLTYSSGNNNNDLFIYYNSRFGTFKLQKINYISGKQWALGNSLMNCLHLPVCQHIAYSLLEQSSFITFLAFINYITQNQGNRKGRTTGAETHSDACNSTNVSATSQAAISKNKH